MRLTKLAALSLLLSAGSVTIPLERAMAQAAPPAAPGAPPPAAPATPPPAAPAAPPPPAAAAAPAAPSSAVTHSSVNLRNGPGTSFTVITLIPAGTSVEVHECKSGWCEATFQGQNGYIIQSSIAPGASGAAARARPRPGPGYGSGYYAGGPPPGAGYDEPPPGYYPPPPPAYYYPYGGPYYGGYWGGRRGYWRRW
jgi:hypothetical protein